MQRGLGKLDELQAEERVFQLNAQKIKDNENFTYTVTEVQAKEVQCEPGVNVTHCMDCQFTCHDSCIYSNDAEKAKCCAMDSSGNCERCKGKCNWKRHRNTGYIFVHEYVDVEKTYEDKLAEYQKATGMKAEQINVVDMIKGEYETIRYEVEKNVKRCRSNLQELRKIALKPDPLSEVEYIDMLIEAEREEHKPRWQERVGELQKMRKMAERLQNVQTKDQFLPEAGTFIE